MFAMPKTPAACHFLMSRLMEEELEERADEYMIATFATNAEIFALSGLLADVEAAVFPYQPHYDFAWIEPENLHRIMEIVKRDNFRIKGPIMDKMREDVRAMCVYGIEHGFPLYYDREG